MAEPIKDLTFYLENKDNEKKEYKVILKPFITGKLKMDLIKLMNEAPKGKIDKFKEKYFKEIAEINKIKQEENPEITADQLGATTIQELVNKGIMTYDEILDMQEPEGEDYEQSYLDYVYKFIKLIVDLDKIKDENLKSKIDSTENEFWESQDLETFQKAITFFRQKINR